MGAFGRSGKGRGTREDTMCSMREPLAQKTHRNVCGEAKGRGFWACCGSRVSLFQVLRGLNGKPASSFFLFG